MSGAVSSPRVEASGPSRIRYVQPRARDGDSVWVRPDAYDFSLDPVGLVRIERALPLHDAEYWDWAAFAGGTCHPETDGSCSTPSLALPSVDLASDPFTGSGWKRTALEGCALRFGADPMGPSPEATPPIPGASATVRALLGNGALYIEVSDDRFVTYGSVRDRLIVEFSNPQALPEEMSSWELRMDGTLNGKLGTGRRLVEGRAERAGLDPTVRRFRLTGVWTERDTLVRIGYEDTDDGLTVHPFASAAGWGPVRPVWADEAVCVTSGRSLRVVRTQPPHDPGRPLVRN
ncbi:MAG: hypothetical protein ABSC94_16315 [Polyangiaceae bacterium]